MPIYEYCCTKCEHVFEEWTKSFDFSEHIQCPLCKADAQRIVSNTSFVLKGGGWYVTEYGNQKKDKKESSETKVESTKELNSSGSVEKESKKESSSPSKTVQEKPAVKVEPKNTITKTTA